MILGNLPEFTVGGRTPSKPSIGALAFSKYDSVEIVTPI